MRHARASSISVVTLAALAALSAVACAPSPDPPPEAPVVFGTTQGLAACDSATVLAHPDAQCHTWRVVAGVSMGGGTASRLGFTHPELWDVVGIMGTPLSDPEFLFGMLETNHLAGFCSREKLLDLVQRGVDLDDKSNPEVFCGIHDSFPLVGDNQVVQKLPAVEDSQCFMFRSDFNHWYRGPDAGRGGGFTRDGLLEIMHDLVAAYGNPFYDNPESHYFPPGVPDTWYVAPHSRVPDGICDSPVVVQGVYNAEYNPDGTLPAVTFCDGSSDDSGEYTPGDPGIRTPVEFLLAVDFNRNGRRDYGEPIIVNARERFRDVGVDGVGNEDEPGFDAASNVDPARDDWDPLTNPTGTEGNMRRDEGEAFDDFGIDGVPATSDFGEGNGVFDLSPNLSRILERSPPRMFDAMGDEQIDRLDVWMDAGIRDFLNSAQISNTLYASMKARLGDDARAFTDFASLPIDANVVDEFDDYFYFLSDYSRAAMGHAAYLRYGDPSICPSSDDDNGAGNHVGAGDVVDRIFTLFSFLSARMPPQGRDHGFGGEVADLAPTGRVTDFAFMDSFHSDTLDKDQPYGVLLPPDYFLPESENERYPVLYFFHGQGQKAEDMVALGLALLGPMKESARTDRLREGKNDLQRAIIIWVDGNCYDDTCWSGDFYADFEGQPRDDRRFEGAFYDLVRAVEGKYRVKAPELVARDAP